MVLPKNIFAAYYLQKALHSLLSESPVESYLEDVYKRQELEKAREKAAEWQAKIRELEKQKQEEENSQIVQAVRSLKLTPAQLMAFLNDPKNSLTASGHTDPKPEAPGKEDTAHEEDVYKRQPVLFPFWRGAVFPHGAQNRRGFIP